MEKKYRILSNIRKEKTINKRDSIFKKNPEDYISYEDQILKSVWEFYEKLYKSCNTYNEYLDDLNLECKLNDIDKTIR